MLYRKSCLPKGSKDCSESVDVELQAKAGRKALIEQGFVGAA